MKTLLFILVCISLSFYSCTSSKNSPGNSLKSEGSTFNFTEVSTDTTYGYSPSNPINVGGVKESVGPSNQRRYLNRLLGPKGEELTYERHGSCCPFKSENGFMGGGLLDKYEIKWDGQEKPIILYLNLYDRGLLKAPTGFTIR